MTAQTIGYVVLTNGGSTWEPDWDGEVHTDQARAAAELADCRGDGHQAILGTVLAYDDEDLAHRAAADTGGIFSVRPPSAPDIADQYAAELKHCLDFTVSDVHLQLLRRLNWRWNGALDEHWWGGPAVSQRRPYGDEDQFGNIAEIADPGAWADARESGKATWDAYVTANEPRFRRLHTEMMIVLEIVLQTGQFAPGRYQRFGVMYGWVLTEEAKEN